MKIVIYNYKSPNSLANNDKLYIRAINAVNNKGPRLYYHSNFYQFDNKNLFSELYINTIRFTINKYIKVYHHEGFNNKNDIIK